jgi:hypothetical protein
MLHAAPNCIGRGSFSTASVAKKVQWPIFQQRHGRLALKSQGCPAMAAVAATSHN